MNAEADREARRQREVATLNTLAKRHDCGAYNTGSSILIWFKQPSGSGQVEWRWSIDSKRAYIDIPAGQPGEHADAMERLTRVLRDPAFPEAFAASVARAGGGHVAVVATGPRTGFGTGAFDDTKGT